MSEHPFERFSKRASQPHRMAGLAANAFEERCVRLLLRHAKLQRQEGELRNLCARQGGQPVLRLPLFCEQYRFPVKLAANHAVGRRLNQDRRLLAANVFAHFLDLPFVKAYEKHFLNVYDEREDPYVGLVFPYKGTRGGWIIHDARGLEAQLLTDLTWVYHRGDERGGRLYVQPFNNFVQGLVGGRHGWRST